MGIRVYNTLTNRKEPFETVTPGKVGIYVCGPTVYKPSHIGHAVGPIIFDAIKRYLVHRGFEVTLVINITDVDDKLIAEAASQETTVPELAERVAKDYLAAMRAFNVTGIDHMPKASEHIGDIIDMCQRLIARGAAYESHGDVYFDITADDDYGKLSNRSPEEQAGQRELVSGVKKHPGDFALWKAAKPDEPDEVKFDSPWGKGRPGWHIECSAMSMAILGDTFDIHGGGQDLIFPHHENEIAQSETCTGKPFAKYWLHNGLTRFNTKKVSKSDPEMKAALEKMTLSRLLEEHSGELLRYFVLSTQYRRPIEFSEEEISGKKKGLATFYRLFERIEAVAQTSPYDVGPDRAESTAPAADHEQANALRETAKEADERFHAAMDDDFNTAAGIAALFELATAINRFIDQQALEMAGDDADRRLALWAGQRLILLGRTLGLFLEPATKAGVKSDLLGRIIEAHLAIRDACRRENKFDLADRIRDGLVGVGVAVEDRPAGAAWHLNGAGHSLADDELLDRLVCLHVDVRQQSRKSKDFALADLVRDKLAEAGVALEDKPSGTQWRLSE